MTVIFRVILVIVSILTMAFMMRKIRQAKVQIEAAHVLGYHGPDSGGVSHCFRLWQMPAPICWEYIPRLIFSSCS